MEQITEKILRRGTEFNLNNQKFNEENEIDGYEAANVFYYTNSRNQWANGFKIWFNGELIHSSKTFKPMQNKLKKLIEKYHLELANI